VMSLVMVVMVMMLMVMHVVVALAACLEVGHWSLLFMAVPASTRDKT
jgi:hypothetical protein